MTTTNRAAIASKIQALLSKTTANGATEAEMLAGLSKARELMDRYQIDAGAVEMEREGADTFTRQRKKAKRNTGGLHIEDQLLVPIARFCDCRPIRHKQENKYTFTGLRSDIEFADYLLTYLALYVETSVIHLSFDASTLTFTKPSDRDRAIFMQGCIDRIVERLREITKARSAPSSDSRALISLKDQLVTKEFIDYCRRNNLQLVHGRSNHIGGYGSAAYGAGRAAGDRASFGRPVSTRPTARIGVVK